MMPLLFSREVFGYTLSLPTYGLILAIAFLLALSVAIKQAKRAGVSTTVVTDLWIAALLSGVIGSKLLLYLLDLDYYLGNPKAIWTTLRSAGVFYGGLLAAICVCLVMVRRRGLDGWLIGDIIAPALIFGQAVGRWGCFAAGCCWGKITPVPWAVTYTSEAAHAYTGVPLGEPRHPVQIYLSLADLALFFILLYVARHKKFAGQVFLLYLMLYAVLRGSLETYRDDPRGELWGLSTSQVISVIVGLVAVILYVARSRRSHRGPAGRGGRKTAAAAAR